MAEKRKICIVTGTRAEYGLLRPLMKEIREEQGLDLQLIATGAHLSEDFGYTFRQIEVDGFVVDRKVDIQLLSDSVAGVTKSIGHGFIGFADAYQELKPDIIVLLGDRYESLAAAGAALIANIPIAHIHGGEVTEGAYDDAIRHSITKMSSLHFTSTETYQRRVVQLGEQPAKVFCVGALGAENVHAIQLVSKEVLTARFDCDFCRKFLLITFHPVTLNQGEAEGQVQILMQALDLFPDLHLVFTGANADNEGRHINNLIKDYCRNKENAFFILSMGSENYLSAMAYSAAVVGNSSSGILEAPSFHVPTVNLGDRQKGRVAAESVIHCPMEHSSMVAALQKALSKEFCDSIKNLSSPYDKPGTAKNIVSILKDANLEGITKKVFFDLPHALFPAN